MIPFIATFIACYAFWLFLNFSLDIQYLAAGFFVALVVSALSSKVVFGRLDARHLHPKRLYWMLRYLINFAKAEIASNLAMCINIINPGFRPKPAVLKIPVHDHGEATMAGIANSITMTPGTLTLETGKGALYVHWISAGAKSGHEAKDAVVGDFEKNMKGVFE